VIDLRSDTMTRPTLAMRDAMAHAVVGDEQYGEDPTVLELERRAAAFLGHEAAVFVPTATMANQIALRILTQPGDELLAEESAHVLLYEQGGPAVFSGLVMRGLPGRHGTFAAGAGAHGRARLAQRPHAAHEGCLDREHPQLLGRPHLVARADRRDRRGGARARPEAPLSTVRGS